MTAILSFGGGVNTFALLALARRGELEVDYIVFSDTGCEYPDTYRLIEEIAKPTAEEMGVPFVHLKPVVEGDKDLYDYCIRTRMVPLRIRRWCTDKFKVVPIKNWIVSEKLHGSNIYLGFDAGEPHRAKKVKQNPIAPKVFPLIERGINRRGCRQIVKEEGWPKVPKSGCWICPFSRLGQARILYDRYPDLFRQAELLEKNGGEYPKTTIIQNWTLEKIRKRRSDRTVQSALAGYDSGGCFLCHY